MRVRSCLGLQTSQPLALFACFLLSELAPHHSTKKHAVAVHPGFLLSAIKASVISRNCVATTLHCAGAIQMPTAALPKKPPYCQNLVDASDVSVAQSYNAGIWTSSRTTGDWLRVSTVNGICRSTDYSSANSDLSQSKCSTGGFSPAIFGTDCALTTRGFGPRTVEQLTL
jgi:hypothetical protein